MPPCKSGMRNAGALHSGFFFSSGGSFLAGGGGFFGLASGAGRCVCFSGGGWFAGFACSFGGAFLGGAEGGAAGLVGSERAGGGGG